MKVWIVLGGLLALVACAFEPLSSGMALPGVTSSDLDLQAESLKVAAPAAPQIPGGSSRVTDFGAIPNDGLDDTAAIQKALDDRSSKGGGSVLFAPGRFEVSIQRGGSHPQALRLHSKLRLTSSDPANPATLRLQDGQGNFESVMGTGEWADPLEDFALEHLTVDLNGVGNPLKKEADLADGDKMRYGLRVFEGRRVRVDNVTFLGAENSNTLTFNGTGASDVLVKDSRFLEVGGGAVDHDHSSIYTNGPRMWVVNNVFTSRSGPGTKGARTAIEIHSSDQLVRGNTVKGFLVGINVVGEGERGGQRQSYFKNTLEGVQQGFLIWSYRGKDPALKFALQDVLIQKNTVQLENRAWKAAGISQAYTAGIVLEALSDGPIDGLRIDSNDIRYGDTTPTGPNEDQFSSGVMLRSYAVPELVFQELQIRRNRIEGAQGPAIRLQGRLEGSLNNISFNTLLEPLTTDQLNYPEEDVRRLRSAVYLEGRAQNLTIRYNTLDAKPRADGLVYGFAALSSCSGMCTLEQNTLNVPGLTPSVTGPGWTTP